MAGKILVTGATGCLGSNLVRRLLDEGVDVAIMVRAGETLGMLAPFRSRLDIRFGDVRDPAHCMRVMQGVSKLYHVAGIAVPLERLAPLMWEVNVVGVHNVMLAAMRTGVERVVHVSSISAVGYPLDGEIADEGHDFHESPESNSYAQTKHAGERVALSFNEAGLPVVSVNPSAVIAPGGNRRQGWAALIEAARTSAVQLIPAGGSAFCSRHDFVEGSIAAMERGRPGERYILTSENLSYAEIGEQVAQVVGRRTARIRVPRALLAAVGMLNGPIQGFRRDPFRSSLLVTENVRLVNRTLFYSNGKARRELGFAPTSIRSALKEVLAWCVAPSESQAIQWSQSPCL